MAAELANTPSHKPRIVTAIPMAGPLTAQTSGFFISMKVSTKATKMSFDLRATVRGCISWLKLERSLPLLK